MRFEVLKRSNLKRNIIIGVVVVAIIIVCIITLTRAKYRSVASTTLIKGEVNYTLADLNLVAVYVQDENGYTSSDEIPESGYALNETDSYCEVNDVKDNNITISYQNGQVSFIGITKRGTKCYLYFDIQGTLLSEAILRDNGTPKTNPTLDATSCEEGSNNDGNCDESENGIYEGEDDYGPTYYYRGTVDNNWVEFAGFYWRIIRINGDGTVRLIYSGEGSPAETGEDTQIQTIGFNDVAYGEQLSYHVGYMYTESDDEDEGQHGTDKDSTIKEELDDWYYYNIYLEGYSSYIADSGFCGDREVVNRYSWVSSGTTFYYAAYHDRLNDGEPTFECSNRLDLYTVDNSKGNEALDYAIGLITADEVMYAGGQSSSNYGYWLYTGQYYWTMSPSYFLSTGAARVFFVVPNGGLNSSLSANASFGVRPVINLSVDVTITGSGTIKFAENGGYEVYDPYVVQTT